MVTERALYSEYVKKKLETNKEYCKIKCIYQYLLNVFVFQYRVMDIEYFMDKCTDWEVNNLIENVHWTDRNLWDAQRLNAYLIGKANFKGINSFKDICKLPWDENPFDKEIDYEQLKEDRKQAKELAEKIFGLKFEWHSN